MPGQYSYVRYSDNVTYVYVAVIDSIETKSIMMYPSKTFTRYTFEPIEGNTLTPT